MAAVKGGIAGVTVFLPDRPLRVAELMAGRPLVASKILSGRVLRLAERLALRPPVGIHRAAGIVYPVAIGAAGKFPLLGELLPLGGCRVTASFGQ